MAVQVRCDQMLACPEKDSNPWILRAQQQIEYYFSDRNLRKDEHLLRKTGALGTGFVELEFLSNFSRLQVLSHESGLPLLPLVHMAVQRSDVLELVCEDGVTAKLRRRTPLLAAIAARSSASSGGTLLLGLQPNLHWCYVFVEELRAEKRFLALPPPAELKLAGPATWSWIRQDDSSWDEVHWGVLSTRHLKGILGFQEPQAAAFLGLPRNMISHSEALSVFHDLLAAPEACAYYSWGADDETIVCRANKECRRAFNEQQATTKSIRTLPRSAHRRSSLSQLRCSWGSAHEASALKNLLHAEELVAAGCTLEEVGLCMVSPEHLAERRSRRDSSASSPQQPRRWRSARASVPGTAALSGQPTLTLIGASPDAMLRLPDGACAAIEVKNVCPFFEHNGAFAVHDTYVPPESRHALPAWRLRGPAEVLSVAHLPQAQLEMLASGTRLTYLMSASALQGSTVFIVERHDRYIDLMLQAIDAFYAEFVLTSTAPGRDFFWDRPFYTELLELTHSLSKSTCVSFRIPPSPAEISQALFSDTAHRVTV